MNHTSNAGLWQQPSGIVGQAGSPWNERKDTNAPPKTAPQEELDTVEELRHHIIIPSSMFFQPGANFFPS